MQFQFNFITKKKIIIHDFAEGVEFVIFFRVIK